ncbi:galectin-3 [Leptodactylus fuscus]
MMLTVTGKMTGKRFNIDYKEGPNIPFHFNPRVDEKPYSVVRNTMMNGEWGQEEREIPKFPFQLGQPFVIKILFDQNCYRVMVNNENFCQYTHRMKNFAAIKLIRIDGNLDISDATLTTV